MFQSLETELQNSPSEVILDILKKVIFDRSCDGLGWKFIHCLFIRQGIVSSCEHFFFIVVVLFLDMSSFCMS